MLVSPCREVKLAGGSKAVSLGNSDGQLPYLYDRWAAVYVTDGQLPYLYDRWAAVYVTDGQLPYTYDVQIEVSKCVVVFPNMNIQECTEMTSSALGQ